MSLERNNNGRFLPDRKFAQDLDHQYIVDAYNSGKSSRAIAIELNSYPKKIQKILKSNGVKFRKKKCYLSGKENPRYTGYEEMQGAYLAALKASAKTRGIEFSVTYEYIWELFLSQDRKCKYSGMPIFFSRNNMEHIMGQATASLDRIDSSKGYVEGNLQWLHKRINIMKGNMDEKEFFDFCESVTLKNKRQTIMKTLIHSESKVKNG
jgi:hypothetical protein